MLFYKNKWKGNVIYDSLIDLVDLGITQNIASKD